MRVVCENCGAVYKIPEQKLVKAVSKATCRKCGHRLLIRRPEPATAADQADVDEATVLAQGNMLEQPAPADGARLRGGARLGPTSGGDPWAGAVPR